MNYTMNFGRLAAQPARAKRLGEAFRIAVLGDFSGRANAGTLETGAALSARKALPVDVDNFEKVFRQMDLRLRLPIGTDGGTVEVKFESIDDFHPDQLYNDVELFSELAGLRRRLTNNSTFAAAAQEMQSWANLSLPNAGARDKPRGSAIPQGKLSDFARLIGQSTTSATRETPIDELIKQIVAPHIMPAAHPNQEVTIAAVDEAISAAMRRIIHHPDFQALESVWRSVDLLTRELETGPQLQLILYDITAEEIAADLSASDALEASGVYRLLVGQPSLDQRLGPLSALIGNYVFEVTPPHAELLGRIGKVAAAAQAPFIAGVSTECLVKRQPADIHPLISASWDMLRQTPQANYLGLTVPRFMLRWPYGAKTEPIDSFRFEEFTPSAGLRSMLWANGSILAGLLLGKTFADEGLAGMQLGSVMTLGDVPFYYYTDADGDQVALPNTERWISEATAVHAISQNFMPVLCIRGRPDVRLGSFTSLAGSELAGPWAPLEVQRDSVWPHAATTASAPLAMESLSMDEIEMRDAAEADRELDALLAEVSTDSTGDAAAVNDVAEAASSEDSLDALLAGLATKEAEQLPTGADDIDPDLAALLADL
jgi:type VI secretion system ImpB/VipA family protein